MDKQKNKKVSSGRVVTRPRTRSKTTGKYLSATAVREDAEPAFYLGDSDPLAKVVKALENPNYRYRTTLGIAKETNLSKAMVSKVLQGNEKLIRRSLLRAPDGSILYSSKGKVTGLEDFWNTIKAINNAKFSS